jgi:hypothetical protein
MSLMKLTIITPLLLMLLACSGPDIKSQGLSRAKVGTACKTPRPEMCTREYRPVCATKFNGIQCKKAPCPDTDKVTYANACVACSDHKVRSYGAMSCEDQGLNKIPALNRSYSY